MQEGQCGWNRVRLGKIAQKGGEVSWGRSCMALLAVFRNLDKATRGMELPLNEMGKLEK